MVGYATYGTQFETLEIQSTNKSFGVSMVFSDWTEEPLLEEKVIWKGEFIAKKRRKIQLHRKVS